MKGRLNKKTDFKNIVLQFIINTQDENINSPQFKQMHDYLTESIINLKKENPKNHYLLAMHQYILATMLNKFPKMYAASCSDFKGQARSIVNYVNAVTNLDLVHELSLAEQVKITRNACMKELIGIALKNAKAFETSYLPSEARDKFLKYQTRFNMEQQVDENLSKNISHKSSSTCDQVRKCLPIVAAGVAGVYAYYNWGFLASALWAKAAANVTKTAENAILHCTRKLGK